MNKESYIEVLQEEIEKFKDKMNDLMLSTSNTKLNTNLHLLTFIQSYIENVEKNYKEKRDGESWDNFKELADNIMNEAGRSSELDINEAKERYENGL